MPSSELAAAPPKSLLDRALSIFAEVRPREGLTALLLAANVFLLLGSYYLLKTVREPLILTQGGAEVKSYAAAGQAALLLLFVGAYSRFAARTDRLRLITGVTLFFISNLVIFYALGMAGVRVGVAFFLWVGMFNVFIVAQFWGFANDVYTEEQGKRLFPIVGVGSSLGAWVGALAAEALFKRLEPESAPYTMMLFGAVGLAVSMGLTWMADRRASAGPQRTGGAKEEKAPLGGEGAFKLIFSHRYLFLIAMLVLLINVVNTTGEFLLGKLVTTQIAAETADKAEIGARIGAFYGDFFGWVNLLGFLIQALLVSRIFKWIGVRGALFIVPLIALGGYGLFAFAPVLAIIRLSKIFENSADYSVQNTARQALFLPTSREAKYKAKAAIDSFFWRIGDMVQAGIVFVGVELLSFDLREFALVNLVFTGIWIFIVFLVVRENKKISKETGRPTEPAAAQAA